MTPDAEPPVGGEPYFAEFPRSRPAPVELRFLYRGELLTFVLDRGIFSARGLDPGSSLLIQNLGVAPGDRVLDLGCGWGAVGVAAAKSAHEGHVVLTEVNRRAARLAEQNLARNRVRNAEVRVGPFFEPVADERFDVIATNPPFRAGRPQVLRLLTEAKDHLEPGGRLLVVGKGSQGIRFYQEWLRENGPGPVTVLDRGSGYRVLEARRPGPARPAEREGPPRVRRRASARGSA
jgi:16S rRNA (guanine1207-N2)-methyltransferase